MALIYSIFLLVDNGVQPLSAFTTRLFKPKLQLKSAFKSPELGSNVNC